MNPLVRAVATLAIVAVAVSTGGAVNAGAARAAPAAVSDGVDWGVLDTTGLQVVGDEPDPATQMVFLLGLVGQGDAADRARVVSDPRSPSYGRYDSLQAVVDQVSASTMTAAAVEAFFAGEGLAAAVDPTRTYAQVVMTLADAERIFSTTWAGFEYPETSTWSGIVMLYPTDQPLLPDVLSSLVDRVHGAIAFSATLSSEVAASEVAASEGTAGAASAAQVTSGGSPFRTGVASGCDAALALTAEGQPFGLSPSQLLSAYGIDELHAAGLRGEGIDLAVIENQRYEPANLDTYRECFGLDDATPVTDHERGVLAPANDAATPEAILDLAVLSFAAPALDRLDVFMVGKNPELGDADEMDLVGLLDMFAAPINAALSGGPTPDVVSASYSVCEGSPLTLLGQTAFVGIFDEVLAIAAASGISYIVSTGDDGSSACNQFRVPWDGLFPGISVQYPASSPFVTAVGGTNIALDDTNEIASTGVWNDTVFAPEAALIASPQLRAGGTGGRSQLVDRPWFQDGLGDSPYRSVPDVSLFADQFPGYLLHTGSWTSVGGTSAAAPLFAGMVALLDQRAAETGQPRPGLVAPLLYELGAAGATSLLDITIGDNIIFPESAYGLTCCAATPGYDLASGWGSPMADSLLAELAPPSVALTATAAGPGPGIAGIELSAAVETAAGQPIRYDWDLDGDGSIDRTTTTGTTVISGPDAASSARSGAGPTADVLGASIERAMSPTVTVTTSMGRSSTAATMITFGGQPRSPVAPTPKPLAFTG